MKVVVTGANGFLGVWLTRALVAEGHDVHALVRPTANLSDLKDVRCAIDHGDVTDRASLERAFVGADAVFHLAGIVSYVRSDRALLERVNVEGTRNVIDAVKKCGVKRLVHLSSVTAIGAGFRPDQILNEESPYNLGALDIGYFETKRRGEELVRDACARGEIDAVILNPCSIYGPGDASKGSRDTQIKVAQGKFPFTTSGGLGVIAVEDAVAGILAAWRKGRPGQRYILAGENWTIRKFFDEIAAAAGVKPPPYHLPNFILFTLGFLGDALTALGLRSSFSLDRARTATLYNWFDASKARRELGFNPRPSRDAVRASVEWMKEHGVLEPAK